MTSYSHSRVECFKNCPYKYKLSYINNLDTLPSDDPANALIVGSALHLGIEQGLNKAIEEYTNKYLCLSDAHYTEILKLEEVLPKVEKYINRDKCVFEYELITNDYKGYIDYIEYIDNNHVKIYDFKYSNNVDNYLKSDQLHLYKYFFEKLNPQIKVVEIGFLFIPKCNFKQTKNETLYEFRERIKNYLKNEDVKLITVDFDINHVVNFITEIKHILECTEFKKNVTNLCNWCNFKNFCQRGVDYELINKKIM